MAVCLVVMCMCVVGMGKTTLAHVVATHCGYRPFEINASDDRSAPALKEKMVRTLRSHFEELDDQCLWRVGCTCKLTVSHLSALHVGMSLCSVWRSFKPCRPRRCRQTNAHTASSLTRWGH